MSTAVCIQYVQRSLQFIISRRDCGCEPPLPHLTHNKARGVQDGHFMVSSTFCGASAGFKLDYYLRLEDMEQWFPCWMQARPSELFNPARLFYLASNK